jgi:hypothetical protein
MHGAKIVESSQPLKWSKCLEEKKMMMQFGEKYVAYKKQIPMLIPGFFLLRR